MARIIATALLPLSPFVMCPSTSLPPPECPARDDIDPQPAHPLARSRPGNPYFSAAPTRGRPFRAASCARELTPSFE